jgi:hypothetical protein
MPEDCQSLQHSLCSITSSLRRVLCHDVVRLVLLKVRSVIALIGHAERTSIASLESVG